MWGWQDDRETGRAGRERHGLWRGVRGGQRGGVEREECAVDSGRAGGNRASFGVATTICRGHIRSCDRGRDAILLARPGDRYAGRFGRTETARDADRDCGELSEGSEGLAARAGDEAGAICEPERCRTAGIICGGGFRGYSDF